MTSIDVLSSFSHGCNKTPEKQQLKGGRGCVGLQFKSTQSIIIVVRKARWQEQEAAGHITATQEAERGLLVATILPPRCTIQNPRS